MKSDMVRKGFQRTPHRALLRATGLKDEDMTKPLIGIANSFCEIVPGHMHLNKVAQRVKKAVRAAGGVPFEFNTIAICDGIAMGHTGMKYSLPSREIIADSVESMVRAHCFDGLICIPNCDKIIPGMLMGSVRVNIPTIFVSGGPMEAGKYKDQKYDLIDAMIMGGDRNVPEELLKEVEMICCPTCGSCSGMFTANSMNCLMEALGLALPGNGSILAVAPARKELAVKAAKQLLTLIEKDLKPRDILSRESFVNAFALDMAMGGSTNTVLHALAIANEAEIDFDLKTLNELSDRVPYICKVSPATKNVHMEDVDRAGGISAILNEISKVNVLDLSRPTVTGKTIGENIAGAEILDKTVIRTVEEPYSKTGGLSILFGNLAPDGSVIKAGAVEAAMRVFSGPAIIFESQEEAVERILKGEVKAGNVVVIRYEGPKGGPGMPEMLSPTSVIMGLGLGDKVAVITDGRFSGGTRGACIGHISPEAAEGGPIAALRNGDIIKIDLNNRTLNVDLSDGEIKKRLAALPPFVPKITRGYLARYARMVSSANTGAILK